MARTKCKSRGRATIEWYKDGVPQYYCYGYIDKMMDEPLPKCRECPDYVDRAQEDLDAWNRWSSKDE